MHDTCTLYLHYLPHPTSLFLVICFSLPITCTPDNWNFFRFLEKVWVTISWLYSTWKGDLLPVLKTTGTTCMDNVLGAMDRNYSFMLFAFFLFRRRNSISDRASTHWFEARSLMEFRLLKRKKANKKGRMHEAIISVHCL